MAFTALRDSLRESLKPQLEPCRLSSAIPGGIESTHVLFDRENHVAPLKSDNEAWTLGGSLAYQSGWLAHIFRLGVEGFGSQKLYAPPSRDGTLLLLPGQESYAALGRYGEVKYAKYTATLYRQYIDTPYVNQQDNRMTPNTFEAYRINGKYDWVQFAAAYIAAIKPRNDNEFISMSEQAGAPPGAGAGG